MLGKVMLERLEEVNGKQFQYLNIDKEKNYKARDFKCQVICKECNEKIDIYYVNLKRKKQSCKNCSEKRKLKTGEEWVKFLNNHRKNKDFIYDKIDPDKKYRYDDKVIVTCPKHGDKVFGLNYLQKDIGCKECKKESYMVLGEDLLNEFNSIFNPKLEYVDLEMNKFYRRKDYIEIKCEKHGNFKMRIYNHLKGRKCRYCTMGDTSKRELIKGKEIMELNNKIYNNNFSVNVDPDKRYRKHEMIEVKCHRHPKTKRRVSEHLKNNKCKKCFYEERDYGYSTQEFLDSLFKLKPNYRDVFDFSETVFINSKKKIKIKCKKHNKYFYTTPKNLRENNPSCSICKNERRPSQEKELDRYFNIFNIKNTINDRTIIKPKELDFFIKDLSLGIELNGMYWHSNSLRDEKYARFHQFEKMSMMERKNLKILNFYEDEFANKNNPYDNKVGLILKEILLFNESFKIDNIYKKDLIIDKLSYKQIREFYKNHSLEFFNKEDKNYRGIFYKGYLVTVFSFNDLYECHNYCTNYNLNEDIDLILNEFPNMIFNLRSDSFNKYKFQDYGFVIINTTLPQYRNFNKKGLCKNRYKRLEKKDPNNPNRIYDCGRTIMVY